MEQKLFCKRDGLQESGIAPFYKTNTEVKIGRSSQSCASAYLLT